MTIRTLRRVLVVLIVAWLAVMTGMYPVTWPITTAGLFAVLGHQHLG